MNTPQLIHVLAHFLAFIIYLGLIGFVLHRNPKALLNRLCALTLAMFAVWSLGDTFVNSAATASDAMRWTNVSSIGWCSFPVTAFWFYLSFTRHDRLLKNRIFITFCILLALGFIYLQWTGYLINDFFRQPYGWGLVWATSELPVVFSIYFFLFTASCIYLSFAFARRTKKLLEKKQAKILCITPFIPLISSSATDVILPQLGIGVPAVGDVIILFWAGGLVHAITRYRLMSFTPAAAANEILATMTESLMLVGSDGKVIAANPETLHLLGYTEKELLGKEFSSITISAISSDVVNDELAYLAKSGKTIPVLVSASAIKDEEGESRGIVVVARDISERKKMEQDLRKSEQKYRTLVDNALIGIGIHQDGKMVFANEKLSFMLGYTLEEAIGLSLAEMIHPDERDFIMARAQRRQMGFTEPVTYEIRLRKKDGGIFYALISNAIVEYNNRPATLINIADLTDAKVRKELEQVNKELEAFSYSVSHDLRAPLRSIDGFSQALLEDYEDKLEAEGKDYLRRVRAATQRMSQLIDDLLNLSRITRAEMRYAKVNLSTLAQEIAAELQKKEPDRQVEFVIGEDISAHGDSHLLRVVLENLLSNAWKFTAKHPRARIEFGATQQEDKSVYFVRDDGAGFDMAYVDKVFVPFQRLHAQTEFPGTGIGMATVQRIIHRHGGSIWPEAEVEKGATFHFTLQS